MRRTIGAFVVLGLIGAAAWIGVSSSASRSDMGSRRTPSPSPSQTPAAPMTVAEVRRVILQAAEEADYEALRSVLQPDTFLSDFGYGVDPIERWERMGDRPLRVMAAILRMESVEEDTNEGRLNRWPVYDAETKLFDQVTERDRELFLSVTSEREFRRLIPNEEYGYVGPRLGILADGTWWFFIMRPGP